MNSDQGDLYDDEKRIQAFLELADAVSHLAVDIDAMVQSMMATSISFESVDWMAERVLTEQEKLELKRKRSRQVAKIKHREMVKGGRVRPHIKPLPKEQQRRNRRRQK